MQEGITAFSMPTGVQKTNYTRQGTRRKSLAYTRHLTSQTLSYVCMQIHVKELR